MIDYYYELKPGTKVFGVERRYVAQYNFHPETSGRLEQRLHNDAMLNSQRVWLQNANGVQEVSRYGSRHWIQDASPAEFMMVKLQATEII